MKNVKRKLNSKDGMTLLIALVGFLVASMISIVLVSAAVTASRRVTDDRTTNQAHLTLQSAAQIVKEEMESTKYTFQKDSDGNIVASSISASGTFSQEMKTAVNAVNGSTGESYSFPGNAANASLKISVSESSVDDVNVSFIMKYADSEKYSVYFTFQTDGSDETVYLTMAAKISQTTDASGNVLYEITWVSGSIMSVK